MENLAYEAITNYNYELIDWLSLGMTIIYLIYMYYKYGRHMFRDISGEDKIFQLVEGAAMMWFILFPLLIVLGIFTNLTIPGEIWSSMKLILMTILGMHGVLHGINKVSSDSVKREQVKNYSAIKETDHKIKKDEESSDSAPAG